MRTRFASLTSRLVLTVVALVVVVAVLIGAAATAALQSRLTAQVDNELRQSATRPDHDEDDDADDEDPGPNIPPPVGDGFFDARNLRPGTILAFVNASSELIGYRLGTGPGTTEPLPQEVLAELEAVPTDGDVHELDLSGLGSYRVLAVDTEQGTRITGLPTEDAEDAVSSLIGWEALLIALGGLLAAAGGLLLVRRQLRPLTEVAATAHAVAELPLSEGAIDLTERVPEHLTDERTEVGQVGAALNTLLAHVESSLEARHRSEQQLRQFVADASHELRTPLATIAGYTELARRRPDDDNVRTALDKVEEESARMTTLVEDMLLLARLDAGRPLEQAPVDLSRLLVEAVSDARVLGPDHRWQLELPDSPVEVVGDEQRLHQVITNLLTNARKHTPPGTTVTVSARPDGFDVHDDGPGFPADFVDHAFERFARVDQARQRAGGAGLGLSLVEAIVRSHGGTVTLSSAPTGTTLAVRLR